MKIFYHIVDLPGVSEKLISYHFKMAPLIWDVSYKIVLANETKLW